MLLLVSLSLSENRPQFSGTGSGAMGGDHGEKGQAIADVAPRVKA